MQERNYEAMDGDQKVSAIIAVCIAAVVITVAVCITSHSLNTTKMYMDAGLVECWQPRGSNTWTKPDGCATYGK